MFIKPFSFDFLVLNLCPIFRCANMAYYGFVDGASRHTRNLAWTTWVIYSPSDELIISGRWCPSPAANNVAEYQAAIGLMTEALSSGILQLIVHLDSQLVVSQLNGIYSIRDSTVLWLFWRICHMERLFTYVHFFYVPRQFNSVADSLMNFMLGWYPSH